MVLVPLIFFLFTSLLSLIFFISLEPCAFIIYNLFYNLEIFRHSKKTNIAYQVTTLISLFWLYFCIFVF